MIPNSDSQFQGVTELAYRVLGGQGVGLQGPRGSRGRPTGSQEFNGLAYRVTGGEGVGVHVQGPRGSRGRPRGSQGVKG